MTKDYKIIAETAFTHQGDVSYLIRQIDEAKKGNCDYVKFQVFIDPDNYFSNNPQNYEKIKSCVLNKKQWAEAIKYAKKSKLNVIVLPLTAHSTEFLIQDLYNYIDGIEVHSVCFLEEGIISLLSGINKHIFLGVGGRLPHEIQKVLTLLSDSNDVILMHGFQSFPTDIHDINLNKLKTLSRVFNNNYGFADHSHFNDSFFNLMNFSYLLGARYFEKHIILEKGSQRIDHESAIIAEDFLKMRTYFDDLILTLGNGDIFELNGKEIDYRNRNKKIVAINNIQKDDVFNRTNISLRVSTDVSDFEQIEFQSLIGRSACTNISKGSSIRYFHVK